MICILNLIYYIQYMISWWAVVYFMLLMCTFNFVGRPVHETTGKGIQRSKIQLNWTLSELNNFVCQCYPTVNLNLIGFHLARARKGWKIEKVHANSVKDLKKSNWKEQALYSPKSWSFTGMTSLHIKQSPRARFTDRFTFAPAQPSFGITKLYDVIY